MLNELWPESIEAQINSNTLFRSQKKGKHPTDLARPMLQVQYAAIIVVCLRKAVRRRWSEESQCNRVKEDWPGVLATFCYYAPGIWHVNY